jgi:hypothetical protein
MRKLGVGTSVQDHGGRQIVGRCVLWGTDDDLAIFPEWFFDLEELATTLVLPQPRDALREAMLKAGVCDRRLAGVVVRKLLLQAALERSISCESSDCAVGVGLESDSVPTPRVPTATRPPAARSPFGRRPISAAGAEQKD